MSVVAPCQAWVAIEEQFFSNCEIRALYLDIAFRIFVQGDLSVTVYFRQMKGLANDLCYLDEPVSNRTLVLNLLRSLGGATTTYGLGSCGSFRSPLSRRSRTTSSLRSSIRGPRFLPPLQRLSIASFLVGCLNAPYSPYWLTLHSYPPGPRRLVLLPLLALLPAMVGATDYSIILQ